MMTLPSKAGRTAMKTVGISEMLISHAPEEILVTYSLGSCVALCLFDPAVGAGLIHCMLPQSSIDPVKARQKPAMFVDLGVPALLDAMFVRGARRRSLVAKVAGGANVFDDRGMFRIGERNHASLRRILWKNDILIAAEHVGGTRARTMYVSVGTGRVLIKSGTEQVEL